MVQRGINNTLSEQIKKTEQLLEHCNIILPPTPPKEINTPVKSEVMRDEMIYRLLLVGIQYFLETHAP